MRLQHYCFLFLVVVVVVVLSQPDSKLPAIKLIGSPGRRSLMDYSANVQSSLYPTEA